MIRRVRCLAYEATFRRARVDSRVSAVLDSATDCCCRASQPLNSVGSLRERVLVYGKITVDAGEVGADVLRKRRQSLLVCGGEHDLVRETLDNPADRHLLDPEGKSRSADIPAAVAEAFDNA